MRRLAARVQPPSLVRCAAALAPLACLAAPPAPVPSAWVSPPLDRWVGSVFDIHRPIPVHLTFAAPAGATAATLQYGAPRSCTFALSPQRQARNRHEFALRSTSGSDPFCGAVHDAALSTVGRKTVLRVTSRDRKFSEAVELSAQRGSGVPAWAASLTGIWQATGLDDCFRMRMSIQSLAAEAAATDVRYLHPRNCSVQAEYSGALGHEHFFTFVRMQGSRDCEVLMGGYVAVAPMLDGFSTYDLATRRGQLVCSGTLERVRP